MSTQKEVDVFLSDTEASRIVAFNSDPILVNAVKKVLLSEIYKNGTLRPDMAPEPLKNGALSLAFAALHTRVVVSNEQLGEDIRGLASGINLLESGFERLAKYTTPVKSEPETNKAI